MPEESFSLSVRRMRVDDLDRVAEIEALAFRAPWSRTSLGAELHHDWATALVATTGSDPEEEIVVGFAIFWTVVDEVHVLDLAVHPANLRRRVASCLVASMIEAAREEGCRNISLEVRRGNEAAQTLYRRHGFRAVGIRPRYYVDEGEDAIIMELVL